jgi:ATP-binding cassette subfamily B protein
MLTAYAQGQAVGAAFRQANQAYVQQNLKFVLQSGAISPLPSLVVRLATTVVVVTGGLLIIEDQLTIGQYVQFIVYLGLLNSGAQQITGAFERLQQGSAAAGRIGAVLHRWPKVLDTPTALDVPLQGNIRFENVGIRADDQDRWVLRHIDLEIPAGTTLGIVGATGSGKSMMLSLLGRIHDPGEGCIRIDGYDLRQLKLAALRRTVVYVPQETLLFSMSLRSNIALGLPHLPDGYIHRAMDQAHLSNDLPQLPRGLDSLVGERGATLSGGQKQRAAIARALVRDPKVLLLDDALASVDVSTSAQIIAELRQARTRRTCIIVTQRLAAVQDADQIIVLDQGRIVERGTPQELLALNGLYAKMYRQEIQQAEERHPHAA